MITRLRIDLPPPPEPSGPSHGLPVQVEAWTGSRWIFGRVLEAGPSAALVQLEERREGRGLTFRDRWIPLRELRPARRST